MSGTDRADLCDQMGTGRAGCPLRLPLAAALAVAGASVCCWLAWLASQ